MAERSNGVAMPVIDELLLGEDRVDPRSEFRLGQDPAETLVTGNEPGWAVRMSQLSSIHLGRSKGVDKVVCSAGSSTL